MILKPGDKVLIAHRRLFETDKPRFFIGDVIAFDAGIIKVTGFSFVQDMGSGVFLRKDESRTKIVSVASYAFLIYELPSGVDIANVRFENDEGQQVLTDGADLKMNLAEYPRKGHM